MKKKKPDIVDSLFDKLLNSGKMDSRKKSRGSAVIISGKSLPQTPDSEKSLRDLVSECFKSINKDVSNLEDLFNKFLGVKKDLLEKNTFSPIDSSSGTK